MSEIEAGTVRTLIVVGGNPVTAFPDTERTRAALASLDTLVVIDVLPTETTELATHVLPAVDQLERADTTWLLDSYQLAVAAQHTPAVVAPAAERRPVWWMVGSLAERLGLSALPRGVTVDSVTDEDLLRPVLERSVGGPEVVVGAPSGVVQRRGRLRLGARPRAARWRLAARRRPRCSTSSPPTVAGDHRRRRADPPRRPGDGLVLDPPPPAAHHELPAARHRPARCAGRTDRGRPRPSVGHRRLGPDGTAVTVTSQWGSVTGELRSDDRLHPEAVALAHGWGDVNVSRLTSADEDIDPLTGMVLQSGVPVRCPPGRPGARLRACTSPARWATRPRV